MRYELTYEVIIWVEAETQTEAIRKVLSEINYPDGTLVRLINLIDEESKEREQ